jgi:hypothetical protein
MAWSTIALIVICIFSLLILMRIVYVKYLELPFLIWLNKFLPRLLMGMNSLDRRLGPLNRGIDFLEKKFEPVGKFIHKIVLMLLFFILGIVTFIFTIFDWIHLLLAFVVTLFFIFTSFVFIKTGFEAQDGKMIPQSPLLIISDQEWQQLLSLHVLSGISLILLCITLSLFFISFKCTLQLAFNPYKLLRERPYKLLRERSSRIKRQD